MPNKAPTDETNIQTSSTWAGAWFDDWPLVWRLPIATALLVLVFAVLLTSLGLRTLEQRQAELREEVGRAFLDTLAGVLTPAMLDGSAPGSLESVLSGAAQFKPSLRNEAVAVCCLADGSIALTSSYPDGQQGDALPRRTETDLRAWIEESRDLRSGEGASQIVAETNKQLMVRAYPSEDGTPLLLAAAFDLDWQREEQSRLRQTALAIDLSLSLLAAVFSFLLVRQSLQPIDRLTQSLVDDAGRFEEPRYKPSEKTEIGRLQNALISRADLQAKAEALAKIENRHARESALARLAAGLAHEVRNPVAGMSAATSTLRRYGDDKAVRDQTLDLIDRGLQSIDHVAASMLSTYRPPEGNRDLEPDDLNDLRTLIGPKVEAKRVNLTFEADLAGPFPASAEAVRQIALNLLLNAVDATPVGSAVGFAARVSGEQLSITVSDSGSGLPDEALSVLTGQEKAEKPQTRRLGLWLVHQLIDDVNGRIALSTRSASGTVITITIPGRTDETAHG